MATVEEATGILKREIERLSGLQMGYRKIGWSDTDEARQREYRGLVHGMELRIQALLYALKLIEGEEEEPCPD